MGPSLNKKDKTRYYAKDFQGDLDTANARTAIEGKFAVPAEKKVAKVAAQKVETAAAAPKTEKR